MLWLRLLKILCKRSVFPCFRAVFAFFMNLFLLYKKNLLFGVVYGKMLTFYSMEVSAMQEELSEREIETYAKDAIDDLDVSILDAIKDIQTTDINGEFVSQVEQYLRVKTMFPYGGNDLEGDTRRVLVRIIEILND